MKPLQYLLLATALSACSNVPLRTDEQAGPTISFRAPSTAAISSVNVVADTSAPSSFTATAWDQGGVQSISINFANLVSNCTVGGVSFSGGANDSYNPVPATQTITATPSSSGQVPISLVINNTLQGPYSCTVPRAIGGPANGQTGIPYNNTVTATVIATNFSGKTSTAMLPIFLVGAP